MGDYIIDDSGVITLLLCFSTAPNNHPSYDYFLKAARKRSPDLRPSSRAFAT